MIVSESDMWKLLTKAVTQTPAHYAQPNTSGEKKDAEQDSRMIQKQFLCEEQDLSGDTAC